MHVGLPSCDAPRRLQEGPVVLHRVEACDQSDESYVGLDTQLLPHGESGLLVWPPGLCIDAVRDDLPAAWRIALALMKLACRMGVRNDDGWLARQSRTCPTRPNERMATDRVGLRTPKIPGRHRTTCDLGGDEAEQVGVIQPSLNDVGRSPAEMSHQPQQPCHRRAAPSHSE